MAKSVSGSLVTRKYSNFKGIDAREGEISLNRSPDALNMYRNYKSSNVLETRPDIELLTTFDNPVFGFFFYEVGTIDQLIVHSGTKLYKVISKYLAKTDDLQILKISHDDIVLGTAINNGTTFDWRYEEGTPTSKAHQFFVYFGTFNSKKFIKVVRYEYVKNPALSEYYLYGYYEGTDGLTYKYVEDKTKIPEDVIQGEKLSYYGEKDIDFIDELSPHNAPASTLPSFIKNIAKTTIKDNGMKPAKSYFFVYNNILYIKDGLNYLQYDGSSLSNVTTDAYIPTTSISRSPSGGGTIYEDVNMLSIYRKNTFVADGTSTDYYLDAQNITGVLVVKVNGVTKTITTDYTVDTTNGKIVFTTAPDAPLTDGQDNVEITYQKEVSGYADRILKCTLLCVFDNRVFFSGNQDYPNVVWHSSLDDPSYVSDLDYYNEGLDLSPVKAMVAGNNALWVFKKPSQANTTVFYHVPTIDSQYGKIYPNSHSGISTGCIATAVNFNDDICFFSDRGLEGISGDITTEQVIAHRSTFIDNKLLKETNYENMIVDEWDGYLIVCIGNKVYLADSRQVTNVNGAYEYDWYYWELSKEIRSTNVRNGILYLGCTDGIYSLTNVSNDVENYWTTPIDNFGYGNYQKITNKRGCVMEVAGDEIKVYAKTNKDAIELIKTYTNVTDYLTARIKKKKFKDIQLKLSSNKKMKLESIIIEAYIGAYIKR